MALRIAPSIVENIEEIVIMGGGYAINNVTAGAEFNFWIDPEAAKIVADCGAPMRIVPLDATHDAYISWEDSEEMLAENSKASKFCGLLMQQRITGYNLFQPLPIHNTAPIHDALAVAALIDPEVLQDLHEVKHGCLCIPWDCRWLEPVRFRKTKSCPQTQLYRCFKIGS